MSLLDTNAPGFELPNTANGQTKLQDELVDGPAVVVFFRGHWCSYCAEQLQTFSELAYDLWRHYDTTVLPISGSSQAELVEMRDRFQLRMQLLSDKDLIVTSEYLSRTETHDKYGEIPVPATFILDDDGVVRYEHVGADPADRTYANYIRHLIRTGFQKPYN